DFCTQSEHLLSFVRGHGQWGAASVEMVFTVNSVYSLRLFITQESVARILQKQFLPFDPARNAVKLIANTAFHIPAHKIKVPALFQPGLLCKWSLQQTYEARRCRSSSSWS